MIAYADWVVKPTVRSGQKRGYSGLKIQRPTVEFGGRIMLERIQYYMSLNPKPQPPIEVSTRVLAKSQQLIYMRLLSNKFLENTNIFFVSQTVGPQCTNWPTWCGKLCVRFEGHRKRRDCLWIRGGDYRSGRSTETGGNVRTGGQALHINGHRERGTSNCVSITHIMKWVILTYSKLPLCISPGPIILREGF